MQCSLDTAGKVNAAKYHDLLQLPLPNTMLWVDVRQIRPETLRNILAQYWTVVASLHTRHLLAIHVGDYSLESCSPLLVEMAPAWCTPSAILHGSEKPMETLVVSFG